MKKFLTVLTAVVTLAVVIACPFFLKKKSALSEGKTAVVTLWHVDSFEGGKGSRCTFLRNAASAFSKKNKYVTFLVTNYTLQGLKTALSDGNLPDLISFGGCSLDVGNLAKKIDFNVLDGGELSKNKRYAVSYLKGGYFKIEKGSNSQTVILSKSDFTSPEIACLLSGVKGESFEVLPSQKACNAFIIKKDAVMIGTQRDVIRLRNNNQEIKVTPLSDYCDLFQYVSLTSKNDKSEYYARQFINYLLSDEVQQKVTTLNMYSVNKTGLYTGDEYFSDGEKQKPTYTFSPYASQGEYEKLSAAALSCLTQDKNYDEIVKYLKQL